MPKISVLTVTCRADPKVYAYMVQALNNQKFRDFEWILVDDHYEQTKDMVKKLVADTFLCVHMPPQIIPPYFARAAALNDGLTYCDGKIVYFMCDYSIPMPECLGRHWEVQERYGGVMLTGRRVKIEMELEEFLRKVKVDEPVQWSDFNIQFFETGDGNGWKLEWKRLTKNIYEVVDKVDGAKRFMTGRNDSCPLDVLLKVNGVNEVFDGCWGQDDPDLDVRLMASGMRFLIDKGSQCLELPHKSAEKKQVRSHEDSVLLADMVAKWGIEANRKWVIAMPRDLKAEREELRKGH